MDEAETRAKRLASVLGLPAVELTAWVDTNFYRFPLKDKLGRDRLVAYPA